MHSGQLVFAQVMAYLSLKAFSRMVAARRAQHKVQDFSCLDQFLVLRSSTVKNVSSCFNWFSI